jgi:hypothetical protein
MPVRTLLSFAVLICVLFVTGTSALAQSAAPKSSSSQAQQVQPSDEHDDVAAMKADLARMRVLVTQMQNNLGLTTNTTTPLYHQFELEIEMWQMLVAQMERRVERVERERGR